MKIEVDFEALVHLLTVCNGPRKQLHALVDARHYPLNPIAILMGNLESHQRNPEKK